MEDKKYNPLNGKCEQQLLFTDQWMRKISHDFKGFFSNTQWALDLLEEGKITATQFNSLIPQLKSDIKKNITLLEEWSKWRGVMEEMKICSEVQEVTGKELFLKLKTSLAGYIDHKKVEIGFEGEEDLILILNQKIILYILEKILHNAIKYSYPNHKVLFKIVTIENSYVFVIKDDGIGISPENVENLFKSDSPMFEGTAEELGLGFSLKSVKFFLYLLKGDIEIISNTKRGTEVSIKVPRFK